jgi:hypothetical protein
LVFRRLELDCRDEFHAFKYRSFLTAVKAGFQLFHPRHECRGFSRSEA